MRYLRLSRTLDNVGQLIPENENPYKYVNQDEDSYLSLYKYTEDQKEYATEIVEKVNRKTKETYQGARGVSGITEVVTDKLVFDFDHDDLEIAKQDTITCCKRLKNLGIKSTDINVSFSGNKGFSVIVNHNQELTPEKHKAIARTLAGDLKSWDTKIYNASRIFRLDYTKHQQSGLYKTPIFYTTLERLSVEKIKEQAKKKKTPKLFNKKTKLPEELLKIEPPKEVEANQDINIDVDIDFRNKPMFLTEEKYVLHKGHIPKGYGNEGMMILAATYKNAGFDPSDAFNMLLSVNDKRVSIYGEEAGRDADEIKETIVDVVYSDTWQGGTYSPRGNELLATIKEKYGKNTHDGNLKKIGSLVSRFKEFISNINDNIIKTGIESLDQNVMMMTGQLVGVLGAPGCHAKGTKVIMFDGTLKNVEDVKIGDSLMGPDSKPRKVLKLYSGQEEMVKIIPKRSEEFIVNKSHILSLTCGKQKEKNKIPGRLNIKVSDYIEGAKQSSMLRSYQLSKTGIELEKKEVYIDPYILGVWLGDGTSNKAEFTTMDKEIYNYFYTYCFMNNLDIVFASETGQAKTYRIRTERGKNNPFLDHLKGYEILNNKHIPKDYLLNDRKTRLALLAGLIDSDGTLESNKKGWMISQKSERLSNDILFLARSLGFHASMSLREKSCVYQGEKKKGLYYHIYISGKENTKDVPLLLSRKFPEEKIMKKDPLHYGFTYEELPKDEFYGFTLDKDHLYLTEDFMIHHNSGKTSLVTTIMENLSKKGVNVLFESLDMHDNMMILRMIQKLTGMNTDEKMRKMIKDDPYYEPEYNMFEDPEVIKAIENLEETYKNVDFNFKRGTTIEDIDKHIAAAKENQGNNLKLVIVDYLEKVPSQYSDATASSGFVARQLSDLASKHDVCIILLLQPQKSAGDASEELLSMRKVKGASVIEQDCRVILTMWRPGFNPENPEEDKYVSLAVVKNNMGDVCKLDFGWDGLRGKFRELGQTERVLLAEMIQKIKQRKAEEKKEDNSW